MCHSLSLGLSRWCTPGKGSVAGGAAEPESRSVGLEKREHRGCGMQSGCKAGKRSSFRAFNHSKVSFFFFLDSVCNEKLVQCFKKRGDPI